MLPWKVTTFRKISVCFFSLIFNRKGRAFPLKKKGTGSLYFYIYMHIPFFIERKRISSSIPPLLFSCVTIHFCSLAIDFLVTVSQLNFMYVSLVFMVSPCWDFRIVLPSFSCQSILIMSGKKPSRRQRYVPALWSLLSAIEGRKFVGLGAMSASRLPSVGGGTAIRTLLEKHKHCMVWNHLTQ